MGAGWGRGRGSGGRPGDGAREEEEENGDDNGVIACEEGSPRFGGPQPRRAAACPRTSESVVKIRFCHSEPERMFRNPM